MRHSWAISLTIAAPFINKDHEQKVKKKKKKTEKKKKKKKKEKKKKKKTESKNNMNLDLKSLEKQNDLHECGHGKLVQLSKGGPSQLLFQPLL